MGQMIAERDRKPVYEKSTIKPKPKKQEQIDEFSEQDMKLYTAEMLKGKRVKHIRFGKGVIVDVEERAGGVESTVTIRFEGRANIK